MIQQESRLKVCVITVALRGDSVIFIVVWWNAKALCTDQRDDDSCYG